MKDVFIHETACVETGNIGAGTKIWANTHIREDVVIGKNCIIGEGVYIDKQVEIGDNCKIQNGAYVYYKTIIDDGVFIGPHVTVTNDPHPRAINENNELKSTEDWQSEVTIISYGASIGAGSILIPGVIIGAYALVGAGSVVTHDVIDHDLVFGNPACYRGKVCICGHVLQLDIRHGFFICAKCKKEYDFSTLK